MSASKKVMTTLKTTTIRAHAHLLRVRRFSAMPQLAFNRLSVSSTARIDAQSAILKTDRILALKVLALVLVCVQHCRVLHTLNRDDLQHTLTNMEQSSEEHQKTSQLLCTGLCQTLRHAHARAEPIRSAHPAVRRCCAAARAATLQIPS